MRLNRADRRRAGCIGPRTRTAAQDSDDRVMVRPSAMTPETLRWFVELADQLLDRDCPDHPARRGLPDAVDWLDSEISRSRNATAEIRTALAELDLIGSATASAIVNCTQRGTVRLVSREGEVGQDRRS